MIRKIAAFVRRIQLKMTLRRVYSSDSKYLLKHLKDLGVDKKDRSDAEIMLVMHALEKGMSFKQKKKGFGKEKSSALVDLLNRHILLFGVDRQVTVASNVLNCYLRDPSGTEDADVREKIEQYISAHKDLLDNSEAGVKKVSKPEEVVPYAMVLDFFKSRSSVRDFSNIPLSKEEIDRALELASTTPSACNRQASRVYVIQNKQKIAEICDNQLGDQSWCNNADTLFFVTEVATFFGSLYERRQPYIDGGMFAMNLVMGLHAQGIASCFKMYIRHPDLDGKIRKIIGIPENEIPIVLVLAGHYPDHDVTSPLSKRNRIYYEIL